MKRARGNFSLSPGPQFRQRAGDTCLPLAGEENVVVPFRDARDFFVNQAPRKREPFGGTDLMPPNIAARTQKAQTKRENLTRCPEENTSEKYLLKNRMRAPIHYIQYSHRLTRAAYPSVFVRE